MSGKTKLVAKDDQVLIDSELVFEEIRKAKGNWKKVEKQIKKMAKAFSNN